MDLRRSPTYFCGNALRSIFANTRQRPAVSPHRSDNQLIGRITLSPQRGYEPFERVGNGSRKRRAVVDIRQRYGPNHGLRWSWRSIRSTGSYPACS